VQDPGNVGAAIRCAAAFEASAVACSGGCADPFSPRSIRASAGHALRISVLTPATIDDAAALLGPGAHVVAAVGDGGTPLPHWRVRRPLLLVLGNEGHGLPETLLAQAAETVTIPLRGGVESLNVAVTAGILLAAAVGLAPSPILDPGTTSRGGST
jgi:RNA methyltransferase, TrmH family